MSKVLYQYENYVLGENIYIKRFINLTGKKMGTKIYAGKHSNPSDQIYLVEKGKIYSGKYSTSTNELKNTKPEGILIVNNSKVYSGKHAIPSHQIMTISGEKVYKGNHTNPSDQIAVISGERLTDVEFTKVIYLLAQRNNLI